MRTKFTLFLVFTNVVLFFFIFHFERPWRAERLLDDSRRKVLGPEVARIDRLEIQRPGDDQPVVLSRRTDGWFLESPIAWPANLSAVTRILNELQFLENDTSFPVGELEASGQTLADYGLESPPMTLSFTGGNQSFDIAIGDITQIGNRLYILPAHQDRVHVVGRSLFDSLSAPLESLRADSIFSIPVFEVRSLTLQTAPPADVKVRIGRIGDRWLFETPFSTRADKARVEATINQLNNLRLRRFIDAQPTGYEQYGLNSPRLRIGLEGNVRRELLLIGNRTGEEDDDIPEHYARFQNQPSVFTIRSDLFASLQAAQESLRDRRVLDFDPARVTTLTMEAPGRPPVILRRLEDGGWQVSFRSDGEPSRTYPGDAEIIGRLLDVLRFLESTAFVSDAPSASDLENFGFNRPERVITLNLAPEPGSLATAGETHRLLVGMGGAGDDSRVYAKPAAAPFISTVRREILPATPVAPLFYRERSLRELPSGATIVGLDLDELGGSGQFLSVKSGPDDDWTAAFESLSPERRAAAEALLRKVRNLRARSFFQDRFLPSLPLERGPTPWRYLLTVRLRLAGGAPDSAPSFSLYLSERLTGNLLLAGSPELDVIFQTEPELADAIFTLTLLPEDPGPPPEEDLPAPEDSAIRGFVD